MKLVKKPSFHDEYYCELTFEMDKFLREGDTRKTYMMPYDTGIMCIRLPGATRGHVKYDETNMITEIQFYHDTCYQFKEYDQKMEVLKDKFIGYKLEF